MKRIRGYIIPLPNTGLGCSKIALVDADMEYHVQPRGAGVDLAGHLSKQVDVLGTIVEEEDSPPTLLVRSYQLVDPVDDDAWYD